MNRNSTHGPASQTHRRLLKAAQRGDEAAIEHVVRCYEPLVRRVVWRLRLPLGCEREDLAQEARIGLVAAIRAWQPERGPFPAFADRCVSNAALLAVKAASARKHQVLSHAASLGAEPKPDGDSSCSQRAPALLDTLPTWRDTGTDPELRLFVHEELRSVLGALPELTDSERAGLAMALNGQSPTRLSSMLPGSPHAVAQAAHRARRKLAAALQRAA